MGSDNVPITDHYDIFLFPQIVCLVFCLGALVLNQTTKNYQQMSYLVMYMVYVQTEQNQYQVWIGVYVFLHADSVGSYGLYDIG